MRNNASVLYSFALLVGDFLATLTAFVVAYIIRVQLDSRMLAAQIPAITYLHTFLAMLPFWLIIFAFLGLYKQDIYERRFHEFVRLFVGCVIGIMGVITVDFVADRPIFPGRIIAVYALLLSFALLLLERTILRGTRKLFFAFGRGVNNALIIGDTEATFQIADILRDTRNSGYHIVGLFCSAQYAPDELKKRRFKNLDTALSSLDKLSVNTIIQTELFDSEAKNQQIFDLAQMKHIAYKFIPANKSLYTGNNVVELFHNFPVIAVHHTPLIGWGRIAKRIFDFFTSIIGLIITAPLMLVLAAVIKLTDFRYPVFYKHKRVTRFGGTFYVYKLRSMYGKWSVGMGGGHKTESDIFREMGREDLALEFKEKQKVVHDPRVMPIGRFMRKTGLDELPQLWNVLKGELSLIGPRAITEKELGRYEKASSLFLSIKPGITGLWQVSGRNEISYEERIALELYYIENWSFLLDLKIAYRTLRVMFLGKGQ